MLVVACVGAAAGLTKVRRTIEDVPVVDIGSSLAPPVEASAPRNFLIIGTDSAVGLDKDDPVLKKRDMSGQLADVIMILRVEPEKNTARILSIPRDTRVQLAPSGKYGRINAAMTGVGGEANLVKTIKRNFGIPIDNYVMLNFSGFRKLVEVLDGVPIYFTTPVRDRNSGLLIEEPGCQVLNPSQALAYARARHLYFYEDGKWRPDGTGDLGRITRQQDFIKRALRKAAEKGLRNPTTALGVINAAAGALRMDSTLDVGTLLELAKQFQSFNPESLDSTQVPTVYAPRGGVDYQEVVWKEAEPILAGFRGVDPSVGLKPSNVIVGVTSRSASQTELDPIIAKLDEATFDADFWVSKSAPRTTRIIYGPTGRDAAILLAAQMEAVPSFDLDETIVGDQVRLVIGSDFAGVRDVAVPVDQLPADLLPSEPTGPEGNGSTDGTGTGDGTSTSIDTNATSTTVASEEPLPDESVEPGVVPTDPNASALCR
ncbi:MAG TPA: LCP family protein [Microthrixaceae bacterium]|nr:LCP family protein [Microthrixaceae bacterium]